MELWPPLIALVILSPALSGHAALSAAASRITVTVTVVESQGAPLSGADVTVVFPRAGKRQRVTATTDTRGQVRVAGWSHIGEIDVVAKKPGYYESRLDRLQTFTMKDGRAVDVDQAVRIELRPIKNPIPMYARFRYGAEIPVLGAAVGFDLLEGDWVAPHGKGRTTDVLVTIRGAGTSEDNYDATLTLSFPNAGDGLAPFEAHPTSDFINPYEAPEAGYQSEKTWRRSRKPTASPTPGPNTPATVVVDDISPHAHHVFRVRTIRNPDGTIRSALYGKLYGDPEFYPPRGPGFGVGMVLSHYLNPTPNDRNLEWDWRRNLATGLKTYQRPTRP